MEHEKQLEKRKKWEGMEDEEKITTIQRLGNTDDGTQEEKKGRRLEQARQMKLKWKEKNEKIEKGSQKKGRAQTS